jgi:hypothetical protein
VIWTAKAALPSFRYPTPYPIPNQGWTVSLEDGRPIVSFRLGDNRVRLRLKSGNQLRRQLVQIRQIISGDAVKGEAAVYERGGVLMVKLVAWLPRPATNQGTGTLTLRTGTDCLLMAVNIKDDALWRYNGDHLRRWTAEHRRMLQRWSDDSKYENRPIPSFADRRKAAVAKYRRRMDSATHEISAQLAGYATRRHFAAVYFDERDHSYLGEGFPWFRLREMMKEKLDARGIMFTVVSGDAVEQPREPLTEE